MFTSCTSENQAHMFTSGLYSCLQEIHLTASLEQKYLTTASFHLQGAT